METFRKLLQENILEDIKKRFGAMIAVLPKEFDYVITIDGMDVKRNGKNITSIPKKEATELQKWLGIIATNAAVKQKKPVISDLDSSLRKAALQGRERGFFE